MKELVINIGTLSSLSNFVYLATIGLKELRENHLKGYNTIPIWDMTNIKEGQVSFAALTAFLSVSKIIRDFIGKPIEIRILWMPKFQSFLSGTDFLKISYEFDLYDWKGMLGGFSKPETNPNNKIFYYSHIPFFDYTDLEQIIEWKDNKREEIKHSISFRLTDIFRNDYFIEEWNEYLRDLFITTISELVVNSLIHGREIAFVGVQRTRKRITACVCDNGIGFANSISRYKPTLNDSISGSSLKAILYASLLSKNEIGLYRAIDDVLESGGYVNISSLDSEIEWRPEIWKSLKELKSDDIFLKNNIENSSFYLNKYVDLEILRRGYLKKHSHFLTGSRITFEIPVNYV